MPAVHLVEAAPDSASAGRSSVMVSPPFVPSSAREQSTTVSNAAELVRRAESAPAAGHDRIGGPRRPGARDHRDLGCAGRKRHRRPWRRQRPRRRRRRRRRHLRGVRGELRRWQAGGSRDRGRLRRPVASAHVPGRVQLVLDYESSGGPVTCAPDPGDPRQLARNALGKHRDRAAGRDERVPPRRGRSGLPCGCSRSASSACLPVTT